MALDRQFITQCAALGNTPRDKRLLKLFGFLAPLQDRSRDFLWRAFSSLIPPFWLQPKQLTGHKLLINPTDWSQTVVFEEVFLRDAYDLDKVSFVPEVIFDCGAHIGMFSLLAKSRFPSSRVIAYEPNPDNARWVRRQIAENALDVELIQAAVSTGAKEISFLPGNTHSGRLIHDATHARAYKVAAVDFPAVVAKAQPASLLLKMDTEGEERFIFPVLLPLLPAQSALFFETHSGESGWREIEDLLVANGFHVEQLSERGKFYNGFAARSHSGEVRR